MVGLAARRSAVRVGARPAPSRSLSYLIVGMAVGLLACGQEEPADTGPAFDEASDGASTVPEPDPQPLEEEDEREPGEVGEHRPPTDAAESADCGGIDDDAPGAFIVFPGGEQPAWGDAGRSPVTVEVLGCSNTFESTLRYEAYHGDDRRPTLEGHTQGGTLGEWREFRFEETYWTPGEWRVVVFEDDVESGERREYDEQTFVLDPS